MNKSDFIKRVHKTLHAAGIESTKSGRDAKVVYDAFQWHDQKGLTIELKRIDLLERKQQVEAMNSVRVTLTDADIVVMGTNHNPIYTYVKFKDNGVEE